MFFVIITRTRPPKDNIPAVFRSIINKKNLLTFLAKFGVIRIILPAEKLLGNTNFGIHNSTQEAAELLKDGIDLITDADAALTNLLSYPLHATLSRSVNAIHWIKFVDLLFQKLPFPTTLLYVVAKVSTMLNSYDCLLPW